MSKVKITSANPAFTGISAGVQFVNGEAEIELPRQQAALEYFERHRFGISTDVAAPKGEDEELAVGKKGDPAQGSTPTEPAKKSTGKAAPKGKADPKSPDSDGTPGTGNTGPTADPAGDGPVGAQHNVGHDGADPGNVGTPTAPAPESGI